MQFIRLPVDVHVSKTSVLKFSNIKNVTLNSLIVALPSAGGAGDGMFDILQG